MKEILKRVPLLAGLADEDLERLAAFTEAVDIREGEMLFREGDVGDRAYLIEAGEIEVLKESSGREMLLAVRRPGEVIGEMSLLEDTTRMASARARCDGRLLVIDKEHLDQLMDASPAAARVLFDNVLARWRATGAMLKQGERMAQLGTLTAGIAHELNNPAAAVKRGAGHLDDVIAGHGRCHRRLGELGLGDAPRLVELEARARAHATSPAVTDALERSDRESELEDWLEDNGADASWELASSLVSMGYDADALDGLAAEFGPDRAMAVLRWLVSVYEVVTLLAEVRQGAQRISEIVGALKTYSFLDQAPVQAVDIHEGLDSTLLILRSKLKQGIEVRREYADALPRVQAYGSELNQVWTNLIDNAADALDGSGTITIRTRTQDGWVEVDVEDDGPGIPDAARDRIFDAFFTTKPPGKGTGLGLDISYNIVVNRHRGDIKVASRPGTTRFTVQLPVNFEEHNTTPPALSAIRRPDDDELLDILESARTVAVVGIKDREGVPAHDVPAAMLERGYTILPVNPTIAEALGLPTVPDLHSLPETPDAVQVFRSAEHVPAIVDDAIAIGAPVVWLQEGIIHEEAAERARAAGLRVVQDTCWRATMNRLIPQP